jgi:hypothetical protein
MPVPEDLVTPGRVAVCTLDPVAVCTLDPVAACTLDPVVVFMRDRAAACIQVPAAASTKVRAAVCTQVRVVEFIRDRPEGTTLTRVLGVHVLLARRVRTGPHKTARTKIVKAVKVGNA